MPTAVDDPVRVRTSQSWAMRCIQVPVLETAWPIVKSRKFRILSELNMEFGAVAAGSVVVAVGWGRGAGAGAEGDPGPELNCASPPSSFSYRCASFSRTGAAARSLAQSSSSSPPASSASQAFRLLRLASSIDSDCSVWVTTFWRRSSG